MEAYKLLNKELVTQIQILKLNNSRLQIENNQLNRKLSEIHSEKVAERCKINENVNQIFGVLNNILTVVNPMINANLLNTTEGPKTLTAKNPKTPCQNRSLSPILDNSAADVSEEFVSQRPKRRSLRRSIPSFDKVNEFNSPCSSSSFRKSIESEDEISEKSLEQNSVENRTAELKMLSTISEAEENQISRSKVFNSKESEEESIKVSEKVQNRREEESCEESGNESSFVQFRTSAYKSVQKNYIHPAVTKRMTKPFRTLARKSPENIEKSSQSDESSFDETTSITEQKTITRNEESKEEEEEIYRKVHNRRENIQAKRPRKSTSPFRTFATNSAENVEKSSQSDESSFETTSISEQKTITKNVSESEEEEESAIEIFRKVSNRRGNIQSKKARQLKSDTEENSEESSIINESSNISVSAGVKKTIRTLTSKTIQEDDSQSQSITKSVRTLASKSAKNVEKTFNESSQSDEETIVGKITNRRRNLAKLTKIPQKRNLSDESSDSSSETIENEIVENSLTEKSSDNSYETLANIQKRQKLKEAMKQKLPKRITKELISSSSKKHKSDSDSCSNESFENKSKKNKKLLTKPAEEKENTKKKIEGVLSRKSHLDIEKNFNNENQLLSSTPVFKKVSNQVKPVRGASSVLNDITSSINESNLSSRPRRNNGGISYTEPNLHKKLRR